MYQIQYSLFADIQTIIRTSAFHKKYDLLFQGLELSKFPDINVFVGRTGFSRHAILRAFIVKHFEEIKSVPKLIEFLDAHPILTEMCGFKMGTLPDESQFYRFLSQTKNSLLQNIHYSLNKILIDKNIVTMNHLIMDSKPIMAATRNNNFKNPKRNTRNKHKKPKRNPSATLGYYSYQKINGQKDNYIFFWGYRTHVIVSKEGIPIFETTLPNNSTDSKVAKKIIKKLKKVFGLKKGAIFIADAAYDERELYNFIVNKIKGQAFIPLNPRNTQADKILGPHGCPLCEAGLEMKSWGTWTENLRKRAKYRCPIKVNKKISLKYPEGCPLEHPKFTNGSSYGCTKYLDITDDPRAQVPRDTDPFKKTYNLRTEVERYFARLGDREAEQTTHYKLRTVKNQMTIAHLSMSLVAYAAAILLDKPERIRCYQTFANERKFPDKRKFLPAA